MPKSRPNAPRKSQLKHQVQDAQVMALCTLANRLCTQADHPSSEKWADDMSVLVENYLQHGKDRLLAEAIARCGELYDNDAANDLLTHVEIFSESVILDEGDTDASRTAGLFLIPVMFSDAHGLKTVHVPSGPNFQKIGDSLKLAGLVSDSARVVLGDRLYTAPELLLPWSKVLRLASHLVTPDAEPNPIPVTQGDDEAPQDDVRAPTEQQGEKSLLGLRFLAGVVIDDKAERPFSAPDDRMDFERWMDRKCLWEDAAGGLLCDALGDAYTGAFAQVESVDAYHEAFRRGIAEFKMVGLHIQAHRILEAAGTAPTDIEAQLSLVVEPENREKIQVTFVAVDQGRELGTTSVIIHPFERRYDLMNVTMDNLESLDLRSVYFPEAEAGSQ